MGRKSDGTVCPECAVGCRLAEGDSPGRASGRSGPSNPDGRLCRHGVRALDSVDDRFTEPQIRRDGELVGVSWETALNRVAREFRAHRRFDPGSLAFFGAPHSTNEENYLLGKLARTLGTNNVDNRARRCHTETARALDERLGRPASTNSLADLPDADTILVVGANPAQRQPVAFNAAVRPAVNDGTTLIHVDPVGNETTRLADLHLQPRPGMDALVCDLLSAGLVEAGAAAESFIAERTTGFDQFRAELDSLDTDRWAEIAGVDPGTVERAVGAITGGKTAAITGTGIEGGRGGSAPDALLNLLLLTGNLGKPGTGLHLFRGLVNEQGALDSGCVPDRLPGHQPVTDVDVRERFAAEWGVEPPAETGSETNDLLAAFGDEIRGALVVGENPAIVKRDREWVTERLAALDTLVLVDIESSETTPYADVVLPAATLLEKEGTVTNLDRQIQRLGPVRSPPGSARPERWILQQLGARLSETAEFEYDGPRAVFEEMARLTEIFDSYPAVSERWPDGQQVCYENSFETADGTSAFAPRQPLPRRRAFEGLELVVTGRTGDTAGVTGHAEIHPADASERGIDGGETVILLGEGRVRATAALTEAVRRGTVSLHAAVADPLVRGETARVTVRPATGAEPQSQ
jgi:predicted molibdopterin-dependent oxidoreductase YjgC